MSDRHLLELAADLHRRHRPFVRATVVWARSPTSGKAGGSALIEPDGTIHGWIGGACAEPAVLREARRVLNDGEARIMYLGPPEELDGHQRPGVVTVPIACASEGSLEVFMEPVLPQPHVVVAGTSPAVRTLARLASALDWRVTILGDLPDAPAGVEVRSLEHWDELAVDEYTPVVVATQGHFDEPALELALQSPATYIGLVASATRAETVVGYLRDRGFTNEDIDRIESPAGLDLGQIEHREIAVAIMARLIQLRAAGAIEGVAAETGAMITAVDPVCGMDVDTVAARFTLEHDGATVYFCCPGCLAAFEKEPSAFPS